MRILLTLVFALLFGTVHGAIFQNAFTTNANQSLGATSSSTYPLMIDNSSGTVTPSGILFSPSFHMSGTNGLFGGTLSLNGRTNKLSIVSDTLYLDGVAVGGSTSTNYYSTIITTNLTVNNNLTVSNLFVQNGSHNTMIISNSLTIQPVKTNLLATTATGLVTNANYGSGVSWDSATLTLSASGGGGSTPLTFNTLTYSSTNVTVDCSLGDTNGAAYKLVLAGPTFFATPTSVPTTAKGFQIWFQQPSTGTVAVAWTNASYKFPGGVVPVIDTNGSAVTLVMFATGPFTNSLLNYVGVVPQIQ
jgi:hypothetical protein